MSLKLINAPLELPVTLAQARQQLREPPPALDAQILSLIYGATEHAEGFGRVLITQTWELYLDCFKGREIELPKPPLQSVTSVKYVDPDGVVQTFAPADYQVDAISEPGRIRLAPTASWPSVKDQLNAVTIRFVAGYGLAAAVPFQIKAGILLHVEAHFDRDERQMEKLLEARDSLLYPHRMVRF